MTDRPMTPEQVDAYMEIPDSEVYEGPIFGCDLVPDSHLHAARIGSGANGRVAVAVHSPATGVGVVNVSGSEARKIAAALLNLADDLDGIVYPERSA